MSCPIFICYCIFALLRAYAMGVVLIMGWLLGVRLGAGLVAICSVLDGGEWIKCLENGVCVLFVVVECICA